MSIYQLTPGNSVYKYKLIAELGSSQADVWLANDESLNTKVALKVMDAVAAPIAHRLYEAQVGAKFRHSNLCEVLYADVVQLGGAPFVVIAQKYYPNGSCLKQLEGPGTLRASCVQQLLLNVLAGLDYLHNNSCFHNDIKPANILVGDHGEYVLTDYGISYDAASTSHISSFYKPHASPEIIKSKYSSIPNAQTDIYQLGLTAYRLLNGISSIVERFEALDEADFQEQVLMGRIPDRSAYSPWVPKPLRRIVNQAIHPDLNKRYQNAIQMRRALENVRIHREWVYGQDNLLQCEVGGAIYKIETLPGPNNSTLVECRKSFPKSGISFRVGRFTKACHSKTEIDRHKKLIYESVLAGG